MRGNVGLPVSIIIYYVVSLDVEERLREPVKFSTAPSGPPHLSSLLVPAVHQIDSAAEVCHR